jgi:glycogen debranching enzyme
MSYHNGSIWPHDNALIAAGCARYGYTDIVAQILSAMFDASTAFELHRLPELFCGFHRRASEPPTSYPVACAPQAWSAAAVYLLLQASLGLSIDARAASVSIARARLPLALDHVIVRGLHVDSSSSVDLQFDRHDDDVSVRVVRRVGEVDVAVLK